MFSEVLLTPLDLATLDADQELIVILISHNALGRHDRRTAPSPWLFLWLLRGSFDILTPCHVIEKSTERLFYSMVFLGLQRTQKFIFLLNVELRWVYYLSILLRLTNLSQVEVDEFSLLVLLLTMQTLGSQWDKSCVLFLSTSLLIRFTIGNQFQLIDLTIATRIFFPRSELLDNFA